MIGQFNHILNSIRRKRLAGRLQRSLAAMGASIEFDLSIRIDHLDRVALGNHIFLGAGTYLNGHGGLQIHDHTIIGPEVAVLTSMHNYKDACMLPYDQIELLRPVTIERCVW